MEIKELTVKNLKRYLKNKEDNDIICIYNQDIRNYESILEGQLTVKKLNKLLEVR